MKHRVRASLRLCRVVAIVLTVYGIETCQRASNSSASFVFVAIVLTVYGIETQAQRLDEPTKSIKVAIVLTVYGIETDKDCKLCRHLFPVAIVLTVYGIETFFYNFFVFRYIGSCNSTYRLRY